MVILSQDAGELHLLSVHIYPFCINYGGESFRHNSQIFLPKASPSVKEDTPSVGTDCSSGNEY